MSDDEDDEEEEVGKKEQDKEAIAEEIFQDGEGEEGGGSGEGADGPVAAAEEDEEDDEDESGLYREGKAAGWDFVSPDPEGCFRNVGLPPTPWEGVNPWGKQSKAKPPCWVQRRVVTCRGAGRPSPVAAPERPVFFASFQTLTTSLWMMTGSP